jgi:hypothetical protein
MSANFYYELGSIIADNKFGGHRYFHSYSSEMSHGTNSRVGYMSDRIWLENNDTVKFVKNRHTGIMTPVDMREFFLVKLRSRPLTRDFYYD